MVLEEPKGTYTTCVFRKTKFDRGFWILINGFRRCDVETIYTI